MDGTHFDKLDVYRLAVEFVGETHPLVSRLRRNDPELADQLHRGAVSIPLNIAEGAGEFSPAEKAKFYRYALRSSAECVAVIDVCRQLQAIDNDHHQKLRQPGVRLIAMLTRLAVVTRDRAGRQPTKRETGPVTPTRTHSRSQSRPSNDTNG